MPYRRTAALCLLLLGLALAPLGARADEGQPVPPKPAPPKPVPPKRAEQPETSESAEKPGTPTPPKGNRDPHEGEVPLAGQGGWHASLILDNDGEGVWTVKSFQVLDHLGCPEVVALDDKGHCHILMSYSGRWTPITIIHDGSWLGGLTNADVDPRVKGRETYVGSKRGHIFQIRAYGQTLVDGHLIARIEGRETQALVAGDFDPRTPGPEILAFTRPGGLYRLTPTGPDGGFEVTKLADTPGHVRDALVLPAIPGTSRRVATVSRAGRLEILSIAADGPHWETVYRTAMGLGRLAMKPTAAGAPLVLYSTHDDGRIVRHEQAKDGWHAKAIYLGPQGPRGIAAGRFDADPNVETVAIFGYGKKVELLTQRDQHWTVETLFEDEAKGHWLCTAEVDGRNATRELVASGFGGRVVLLARPPGYGRTETAAKR